MAGPNVSKGCTVPIVKVIVFQLHKLTIEVVYVVCLEV